MCESVLFVFVRIIDTHVSVNHWHLCLCESLTFVFVRIIDTYVCANHWRSCLCEPLTLVLCKSLTFVFAQVTDSHVCLWITVTCVLCEFSVMWVVPCRLHGRWRFVLVISLVTGISYLLFYRLFLFIFLGLLCSVGCDVSCYCWTAYWCGCSLCWFGTECLADSGDGDVAPHPILFFWIDIFKEMVGWECENMRWNILTYPSN